MRAEWRLLGLLAASAAEPIDRRNSKLGEVEVEEAFPWKHDKAEECSSRHERDHQRHRHESAQCCDKPRPIAQSQRKQQCQHKAGDNGAGRVERIVPRSAREMCIGKKPPIIIETDCVLTRKPSNKERVAEYPHNRPIGKRRQEDDRGSEERSRLGPARTAKR